MSIDPTTPGSLNLVNLVDTADPEATAMALAVHDAQKSRQEARTRRRAAYQDRIDLLHRSADKLRSMANSSVFSGVFRGMFGMASSGLGCSNSDAAKLGQGLIDAMGQTDPFAMRIESQRADQKVIDIQGEEAAEAVSRQDDLANEASRFENSVKQQLQKLYEKRAAAMEAAARV